MSYNFETQYNSPNYTPGNNGRKFIVIHLQSHRTNAIME